MNTQTPQQSIPQNPRDIVADAHTTLNAIKGLVRDENKALTAPIGDRNMPAFEAALPEKKKLSLRLERLIHALKQNPEALQSDAELKAAADAFKADMEAFQQDAIDNINKLRAAHTMRADFISMVKDTVMKLDASQTYAPNGLMADNTGPTRTVMGKNV